MVAATDTSTESRIETLQRELALARAERDEALAQQTALAEMVQSINGSAGDLMPVFDLLVDKAAALCGAAGGELVTFDGDLATAVSLRNVRPGLADFWKTPQRIAGTTLEVVRREGRTVHRPDMRDGESYRMRRALAVAGVELGGIRTFLQVPLKNDRGVLGLFMIFRHEVRPFSDRQVALVEAFAAHAVIAMENARLIIEQREALEQQTATADILRVISQSPTDVSPVLKVVASAARRFCGASDVVIGLRDGDDLISAAHEGPLRWPAGRRRLDRSSIQGRAMVDGTTMHIPDVSRLDAQEWHTAIALAQQVGFTSALAAPMMRDGVAIGALHLRRPETGPFTPRQIALLETFAAQAVIAIENVRLFTELRDSLEQQTATAEILRVISQSPTDVTPVLDAVARAALRFCGAEDAVVTLREGEQWLIASHEGPMPASLGTLNPLNRETSPSRAIVDGKTIHFPDIPALDPVEFAATHDFSRRQGFKAALAAPMLREGKAIGAIALRRAEPGAFTARQIALLESFAAQAVIALENTRLFTELTESLDQQTATADILRVISQSPTDVTPVLESVSRAALRFCGAEDVLVALREGGELLIAGHEGPMAAEVGTRLALNRQTALGQSILEGRTTHFPEIARLDPVEFADAHALAARHGFRAALAAPMLRDGAAIGAIALRRSARGGFTARQTELLESFAAQAVIALENTRLFTELRESLAQQTATAEILRTINASPEDLQPVFDAVVDKAMTLCDAAFGMFNVFDGTHFNTVAMRGVPEAYVRFRQENPPAYGPDTAPARLIAGEDCIHVHDMADSDIYRRGDPNRTSIVDLGGARTIVNVALRKDGTLLGMLAIYRQEVRPFTEQQIGLLQSFAAQAVIAMENARLLAELKESLDYQTATSELLDVINRSAADVGPVFDTMLASAARLCGVDKGDIAVRVGEGFRHAASLNPTPSERAWLETRSLAADRATTAGRALLERRVVQTVDQSEDPDLVHPATVRRPRTVLAVPLLHDGEPVGVITLLRDRVEPFGERQIALIRTFADQAVIAMENARLLAELHQRTDDLTESLEYQTATSEVLAVISRSPADLQPVLEAMTAAAVRLCGVRTGGLSVRRGDSLHFVALVGQTPEFERWQNNAPIPILRGVPLGDVILDKAPVHIVDLMETEAYKAGAEIERAVVELGGHRTLLHVPLLRDGEAIGALTVSRTEPKAFTERQIGLIKTFADQAVIAMENARLLSELRRRTDDLTQSLEYQTATSDVLEVISRSAADLQPVLDKLVALGLHLGGADDCGIVLRGPDGFRFRALAGASAAAVEKSVLYGREIVPARDSIAGRALLEGRTVHVEDIHALPEYALSEVMAFVRTALSVPLLRDGQAVGVINLTRNRVEPFSKRQIALVRTFADQAVIAMENARLFSELRESLDQQTAMAEVLGLINSATGDVTPVLDAMVGKAMTLCDAPFGVMYSLEGEHLRMVSTQHAAQDRLDPFREPIRLDSRMALARVLRDGVTVRDNDLSQSEPYRQRLPLTVYLVEEVGIRTLVMVPLISERGVIGLFVLYRLEVRPFTDQQVALVEAFAQQAVVAMENARLLAELTRREEELRVTFDHMGDGVVMFDADLKLASWNRNFQQLLDMPDSFLAGRPGLEDYVRLLVQRGELGQGDPDAEVARHRERAVAPWKMERTRPDGRIVEVRNNPVPGGGAVLIYSDITERKRAEAEIRAARDAAEAALDKLRAAQANLIQSEKMASLGQLTAGIAHEIKNPLNFVNNFASLSVELLEELKEVAAPGLLTLDDDSRAEVDETMQLLSGNLGKIVEHGKRADGIVRSMLSHSRGGTGDWQVSNINLLVDDALNLAFHGARANDKEFNVTLERELAGDLAPIEIVPQDVTRVFLNLFGNGFYAANQRRRTAREAGYRPTMTVVTRDLGDQVEVRVRDNGTGIPPEVRDKLFQPFFTTKPTGEGTGLGLSISYDIVTQQHGGTIEVASEPGAWTEFTVRLPRRRRGAPGTRS
ncbi:MAG: GAF domain-containing protein [Reyranellaceae bacterium]